ncbi:uncharacterized protein LOC128246713 [Mya arenaria]|uniref:uncharacterized protein LOC128246713 n=1 Tax=Mya arenaria TaxID=6604 RepID=UPI0022E75E91|nr:uncharacterized protein LOC128246713 [Mya arenaria]
MKSINVFTFLGVIVCGSVLALVSAATTADTTMDGEITEVSTPEFSATNTDFEPYYCTVGTCSGTDNSCLKTLESTCKITDDANGCQVTLLNGTVTAECTSTPCTETGSTTKQCCKGAGCADKLFSSPHATGNSLHACLAMLITLASVVTAMIK